LHEALEGKKGTILAVSQNDENLTKVFMREYGLSLPVLLDATDSYAVSNAYGLTTVPTLFYINQDAEIEQTIVGWDRKEMDAVAARLAEVNGFPVPVFRAGESIPDFKAG
jgi:peroxiredoxin